MDSIPTISSNHLLAALPYKDYEQLLACCEEIELKFAEVLYRAGDSFSHVYFPTTSSISLVATIDDHHNLEVGLVGNEGMLGFPLILAVDVAPFNALVQGTGQALRLPKSVFLEEFDKSIALQRELKQYFYVVMSQIAQTAGCNRFHVVEARLARWLLMTHDRAQSDQLHITHVYLAHMLGVRRVGITKAANSLQKKKLISYKRGNILILDRAGLEAASCGCYQVEKEIYAAILDRSKN
jgi:CRP-like cAMP-binding protein